MSDVIQLRPEVMELVREIAQRPDSVLLRVKPGAEMCALREDRSWLTGSESSLSRAERHLVEVYREEVAYALRQVAWAGLCDVKTDQGVIIRRLSVRAESAPADRRSATIALARATQEYDDCAVGGDPQAILHALVDPSACNPPSVISVCAASQRLVPSFRARHIAAAWYGLHSRLASALLGVRPMVATAKDELDESLTYALIADVAAQGGEWERAQSASTLAIERSPELIAPYVALAWSEVQMGELKASERALRDLSSVVGSHPEALANHVMRYEQLADAFRKSLNQSSRIILRRLIDGPVELGRVLFHAVQ